MTVTDGSHWIGGDVTLEKRWVVFGGHKKGHIREILSPTPSVPNYKSFQESWRVKVFQV